MATALAIGVASHAVNAAIHGNVDELRVLFRRFGQASSSDDAGASQPSASSTASRLPNNGAIFNVRDARGRTPLHMAASYGQLDALDWLLNHGAACDIQDTESGWTALHRSLYFGQLSTALRLIAGGAGLYVRDKDDMTPLDIVTHNRILFESGAYVDADARAPWLETDSGDTPDLRVLGRNRTVSASSEADDGPTTRSRDRPSHRPYVPERPPGGATDSSLYLVTDVYSWGPNNANYTLGHPDADGRTHPQRIEYFFRVCGRTPVVYIVTAKLHSVFLLADGTVHTCGFGRGGRLGHGSEDTRVTPAAVLGVRGRVGSVAAARDHTACVTLHGDIYVWGRNDAGQLGVPGTGDMSLVPLQVKVLKGKGIEGVACGRAHTAVFGRRALYTWGQNKGQLGHPKGEEFQFAPRLVASIDSDRCGPIAFVAANELVTCVLSSSGDAFVLSNFNVVRIPNVGSRFPQNMPVHRTERQLISRVIAGPDKLIALITAPAGEVFVWEPDMPAPTPLLWLLHRQLCVVDLSLGISKIAIVTDTGSVYTGVYRNADTKAIRKGGCVQLERVRNQHGIARISCDMRTEHFVSIRREPQAPVAVRYPRPSPPTLSTDLANLLTTAYEGDGISDVVLTTSDGMTLPAHSVVIASRSARLADEIRRASRDSGAGMGGGVASIVLDASVDFDVASLLVQVMYTGTCSLFAEEDTGRNATHNGNNNNNKKFYGSCGEDGDSDVNVNAEEVEDGYGIGGPRSEHAMRLLREREDNRKRNAIAARKKNAKGKKKKSSSTATDGRLGSKKEDVDVDTELHALPLEERLTNAAKAYGITLPPAFDRSALTNPSYLRIDRTGHVGREFADAVLVVDLKDPSATEQPDTSGLLDGAATTHNDLENAGVCDYVDGDGIAYFRCHSALLGCRSDYFNASLSLKWREDPRPPIDSESLSQMCARDADAARLTRLTLPAHFGSRAVRCVLDFIYGDDGSTLDVVTTHDVPFLFEVMAAASSLLLTRLVELCEAAIACRMDLRSIVSIAGAAEAYGVVDLCSASVGFILRNAEPLLESRVLDALPPGVMDDLVAAFAGAVPSVPAEAISRQPDAQQCWEEREDAENGGSNIGQTSRRVRRKSGRRTSSECVADGDSAAMSISLSVSVSEEVGPFIQLDEGVDRVRSNSAPVSHSTVMDDCDGGLPSMIPDHALCGDEGPAHVVSTSAVSVSVDVGVSPVDTRTRAMDALFSGSAGGMGSAKGKKRGKGVKESAEVPVDKHVTGGASAVTGVERETEVSLKRDLVAGNVTSVSDSGAVAMPPVAVAWAAKTAVPAVQAVSLRSIMATEPSPAHSHVIKQSVARSSAPITPAVETPPLHSLRPSVVSAAPVTVATPLTSTSAVNPLEDALSALLIHGTPARHLSQRERKQLAAAALAAAKLDAEKRVEDTTPAPVTSRPAAWGRAAGAAVDGTVPKPGQPPQTTINSGAGSAVAADPPSLRSILAEEERRAKSAPVVGQSVAVSRGGGTALSSHVPSGQRGPVGGNERKTAKGEHPSAGSAGNASLGLADDTDGPSTPVLDLGAVLSRFHSTSTTAQLLTKSSSPVTPSVAPPVRPASVSLHTIQQQQSRETVLLHRNARKPLHIIQTEELAVAQLRALYRGDDVAASEEDFLSVEVERLQL